MHNQCQGFLSDIDVGPWKVIQSGLHTLVEQTSPADGCLQSQFQLKVWKTSQPELLHSNDYISPSAQRGPFYFLLWVFPEYLIKCHGFIYHPHLMISESTSPVCPVSWIYVGDPLLPLLARQYLCPVPWPAQPRSNILHGWKLSQGLCLQIHWQHIWLVQLLAWM